MGAKKAERAPEGVLASMIVICESVADENHLKPLMDHGPRGRPSVSSVLAPSAKTGANVACVSMFRTSLPPARSVIHCPLVQAFSGFRDVRCWYAVSNTFRSVSLN
jgi:hypothetical protein